MANKLITITGELGSGKSTVSRKLAALLGARRYSAGDAQREIAKARGISTLELNLIAENDPSIDKEIDSVFAKLRNSQEALVVDSRMAWLFLPESVKVKLTVSPIEAAKRVFGDTQRVSEKAETVEHAFQTLKERRESERRRFQKYYNVDIEDAAHFDYIVDTTLLSPDQVAESIFGFVTEGGDGK
ncbi:MAG: cytidylate kinase family protein [Alphaproteobacteria bacterium]|nr:cytidylate kinase family protein [Alphaproteobacteria bacterium]